MLWEIFHFFQKNYFINIMYKLLFILLANESNYSQNSQPTQMEVEPPQGPPTELQNHPPPPPQASGARGGGRSTFSKILHLTIILGMFCLTREITFTGIKD